MPCHFVDYFATQRFCGCSELLIINQQMHCFTRRHLSYNIYIKYKKIKINKIILTREYVIKLNSGTDKKEKRKKRLNVTYKNGIGLTLFISQVIFADLFLRKIEDDNNSY